MRKIIILFATAASVMLHAYAQETWNAVKLFEIDTTVINSVGKMYIDYTGTQDGDFVFCFHTKIDSSSYKTVKTDIRGNVIDITEVPSYSIFTVFNGDTLYITNTGLINATSGNILYRSNNNYVCLDITSSSSGLYVYLKNKKRGASIVRNMVNGNDLYYTINFCGFCCDENGIYIIEHFDGVKGYLNYVDEKTANITQFFHTIDGPEFIVEYKGTLYVYSKTEKAVYRLEPSDGTAVYSITELKGNTEPIHYGLDGRMIESSTPGIHILKYPDGKVNKIVVR